MSWMQTWFWPFSTMEDAALAGGLALVAAVLTGFIFGMSGRRKQAQAD